MDCGSLQDPQDGRVVLSGTIFGSTATYNCNTGFILVGEQTRTCQASGEWSGKSPFCRRKYTVITQAGQAARNFVKVVHSLLAEDCGSLQDPQNGQVTLTGTVFGSTATYSCNTGFILVGERTRVCRASGEWSGKSPICQRRFTFLLADL